MDDDARSGGVASAAVATKVLGDRVPTVARTDPTGSDAEELDLSAEIDGLTLETLVNPRSRPTRQWRRSRAPGRRDRGADDHGDHATTAGGDRSRARHPSRVITGAELNDITTTTWRRRRSRRSASAHVAEHKRSRWSKALQSNGEVVSDDWRRSERRAVAKQAEIGVAMGITGTEVTKKPVTRSLTDDNFPRSSGQWERSASREHRHLRPLPADDEHRGDRHDPDRPPGATRRRSTRSRSFVNIPADGPPGDEPQDGPAATRRDGPASPGPGGEDPLGAPPLVLILLIAMMTVTIMAILIGWSDLPRHGP